MVIDWWGFWLGAFSWGWLVVFSLGLLVWEFSGWLVCYREDCWRGGVFVVLVVVGGGHFLGMGIFWLGRALSVGGFVGARGQW